MSNPNGPIRRRRIAGESKPAVEPTETRRKLIPKAPRKSGAAKPSALIAPPPIKPLPIKPPPIKDVPTPNRPAPTGSPVSPDKPVVPARTKISVPPRQDWRWFVPLTLVAVAALVFGAVFAVKGVADFRDQRGIDGANTKAAAAAGKAAETIFSFQYTALPKHLTDSKALMTPNFQKEFDKIAPALTDLAPQRQIQVQAQSRNAAALECGNECSPTKASVLVFLDQARLVGTSKVPTVFGNRIVVDMVKRNGAWLVNDIKAL